MVRSLRHATLSASLLILLGAAAGPALAETTGSPPPLSEVPESWCASMHLSGHLLEVGQKATITGTVSNTGACIPDSWSWSFWSGLSYVSGCEPGTTTRCTFKAAAATGTPEHRYVEGCIEGNSSFGGWTSCDYYAVLPHCKGHPTLKLQHRRVHGATIIDFRGKGWDIKDCGVVTLFAAPEGASKAFATYDSSDFHGTLELSGRRICGLDLYARQEGHHVERKVSFKLGRPLPAVITLIHPPGATASGEPIDVGDVLCRKDLSPATFTALQSGSATASDLASVATSLNTSLIELEGAGAHGSWSYLADSAGRIGVYGMSREGALDVVTAEGQTMNGEQGVTTLNSGSSGPLLNLGGPARVNGSLSVQGDLNLDGGWIYVEGNLEVSGAITGKGAVFATGNITASGASLATDSRYGLVAGGQLNLP